MPESIFTELLKVSILGPILVALGYYARKLQSELTEVQEKRVLESKAVTDKLIEITDKWNVAFSAATVALTTLESTLSEVKDAVRDLRQDLINRSKV